MITHWGLLASLLLAPPQGPELRGTVHNLLDAPLEGVSIHLSPLPESPSQSSRYDLAQREHWSRMFIPRTTSDGSGVWSLVLTPDQAALLGATFGAELTAAAPGYLPWRRTWTPGTETSIVLEPSPATPFLKLRLQGQSTYRGFLLVERPYRWRPDRVTWRGDLLPLGSDGTATFHEPPRISGEAFAASPQVRAEAYRITLLVEGLARLRATIPPGDVVLDTASSRLHPIEDSLTATYDYGGDEITLSLPGPTIPILQGKPPLRLGNLQAPDAPQPQPASDLHLVLFRNGSRVANVGVWVEDRAVEAGSPNAIPFGVSDTNGLLTLRQLPFGRFHFLFQHPDLGMREIPVLHEPSEPSLQVRLIFKKPVTRSPQGKPGTLLLDLANLPLPESPTSIQVGVLGGDQRLVRTTLRQWHRLIRIDGLEKAGTTLFVRVGDNPPILLGGLLARNLRDQAVDLSQARLEHVTLYLRDHLGNPETHASMGLREGDSGSTSTDLFQLIPQQNPGQYKLKLRLIGNLWARIHGGGAHTDVILPSDLPTGVIDTTLR